MAGQITHRDGTCKFGGLAVDFVDQVAKAIFPELQPTPAKRVSLDYIAADQKETAMHLSDNVGAREHKIFITPLFAAEIIHREVERLNAGAHGSVVDEHPFTYRLKVGTDHRRHLPLWWNCFLHRLVYPTSHNFCSRRTIIDSLVRRY